MAARYLGRMTTLDTTASDDLFTVRGKIALVTGGTSGIGLMIARGLVRRGVKTYIVSRALAQSQATAAELSADGLCIGLAADLAEPDGAQRLSAELARRESRLHILINNAGASERGVIDTVTMADWDR